jgi:hypothetical protein
MSNILLTSQLNGMNLGLSPFVQPQNAPVLLNGCNPCYELGSLLKDVGYPKVGDTLQANKSVTGLFNFYQNAITSKILATINNSAGTNLTLKWNNSGTWTDISLSNAWDAYEDCAVEMEGFIGYCFFVGYDATDNVFLPVASLTGTTFSTSTNVTSMPQGKYIVRYRDRLYVLNTYYGAAAYPYRIVASSPVSAGAITWSTTGSPTSSTGGFMDVDYGEAVTGGREMWDKLVVFTEFRAWMYDQSQFKHVWDTGCSAHRSIQSSGGNLYWVNADGVQRSSGGQPQNISGPVFKFIKKGTPRNFFSCIIDEEYCMYVGTVTVDDKTYTNCELIFNIPTSTWRIREYANAMTAYARYNNSGVMQKYMGATSGEVFVKGKYTDSTLISYDGASTVGIGSSFELAPLWLDTSLNKRLKRITAFADRAQGLNLQAHVLDRNLRVLTPYKPLGKLTKYVNDFDVNVNKGSMIQIAGAEYSTQPYWSLQAIEAELTADSNILKNPNR